MSLWEMWLWANPTLKFVTLSLVLDSKLESLRVIEKVGAPRWLWGSARLRDPKESGWLLLLLDQVGNVFFNIIYLDSQIWLVVRKYWSIFTSSKNLPNLYPELLNPVQCTYMAMTKCQLSNLLFRIATGDFHPLRSHKLKKLFWKGKVGSFQLGLR